MKRSEGMLKKAVFNDGLSSAFNIPEYSEMKEDYYNGMFPCFLGGLDSVLFCVISSAPISFDRVILG